MSDLSMTATRVIAASPARVFDAWLNPAVLARFMTPVAGRDCLGVTNDPRVGGAYEIIMAGDSGNPIPHSGIYREITPHSRLSFTWNSPHAAKDSVVTIDFAPEGAGTKLTLTHVKFPSEGSRDGHVKGWATILSHLEMALA
jgi:uncharacterized protein YndB with AHSA1/START domain